MSQSPQNQTVPAQPQSNIYTVLLLVAVVLLTVAVGLSLWRLMSGEGYDMGFGELLQPMQELK